MAKPRSRKRRLRRVGLAYQLGPPYLEQITHGILRYAQENGPWEIVSSPEGADLSTDSLATWDGDGVIAMLETGSQIASARALSRPVVNLATSQVTPGIVTVSGDQKKIGHLAADHLLEKNFRRFGYYGLKNIRYSAERLAGFRDRLAESGYDCDLYETGSSLLAKDPWQLDREELGRWLQQLVPPVGIFASHDYRARLVLQRCADLNLRVPDDIAVIGVDDDPIVCRFSNPQLTSIRQNGEAVGYRAAEVLDLLMSGKKSQFEDQWIDPEDLFERGSTRIVAVDSPALRQCLDLIGSHFQEPIDIAWLVDQLPVSRRRLEKLFEEELGMSPHQFLSEARIEKAQSLLDREDDMPLKEIARLCGFPEPRRLNIVFERITGTTPAAYRKKKTAELPASRETL